MTTRNEMKVSVAIGLTLPIPDQPYGMVKPEIRLDDIDPYGDVDMQLAVGLETAAKALVRIDEHLEIAIGQMLAPETDVAGYRERLAAIENLQVRVAERVNQIVKRIRDGELAEALTEEIVISVKTQEPEAVNA